ncbi:MULTISPECIES: putative ABC transporter permease [unclassified Ruminococcus]|uniref:putative ABC transporter permease n=1 Tax=unclassified Ruminococcus TaxID=2608920 RepID=UPI002109A4BB|nr:MULTISPECIES: putative ABC transporter permease [unclassified Ruminococcus]MCQ4021412.1 hypothetical protein [Ruminococcus sp. zg-924]MCQ4113857.1 hypothetical protein [Ruminococcus sp. zg-921]
MFHWDNCVFYFILFSILGWAVEEAITSFEKKTIANVGYLNGPYCPIYGLSVTICYIISELIIDEWYAQLIIFTIAVSAFVFCTGIFLQKVLHCRLWDYSTMPLNIKGFITVPLSVVWGIVLTIIVGNVLPLTDHLLEYIPNTWMYFIFAVFGSILLIDTVVSTVSYLEIRLKVRQLNKISEKLAKISHGWGRAVAKASIKTGDNLGLDGKINEYVTKAEIAKNRQTYNEKEIEEIKKQLDIKYEKLLNDNGFFEKRAVKNMDSKSVENDQQLTKLYNKIADGTKQLNRREYEGYFQTEEQKPFAYGVNFYKLFWLFVIGSLIGCIMETIVGFIYNGGVFEYRVGLVYGPFIPVYGIGAVMMTLALYKFSRARIWIVFLVSAFVGATFEYLTSYFQQLLFGTISWDYSQQFFNLYGRTSLYYAIIWGLLGIAWAKFIYPFVSMLIEKLPKGMGKLLSIVLCVFMVYDCVISCLAQWRYNERQTNPTPSNVIEEFLDEQFPDEYIEMIYPHMRYDDGSGDFVEK